MRSTLLVLVAATCFLALSGFECASTEMTTAKVAMNAKDFKRAEENLRKEVAARPQNSEAWLLLAQVYETQRRYGEMNDAFAKAEMATQPPLDAAKKDAIVVKRFNLWLDIFNTGIRLYGNSEYDLALRTLDTAITVRPDFSGNLYMKGVVAQGAKQNDEKERYFKEYITAVNSDVERGMKLGLALGRTRKEVEAKLGPPSESQLTDTAGGTAFYASQSLAVTYDRRGKSNAVALDGWKFVPPSASKILWKLPTPIYSDPYFTLGVTAYMAGEKNKSRYDEALRYLQTFEQLDPESNRQEPVGPIIGQIYVTTGRTGEARARFDQSLRENPDDPLVYINYGNLLLNLNDFQGAVGQYQGAMRVSKESDEPYQQALFNTGAAYKNWSVVLQDSLRKLHSGKPVPKAQEEIYLVKLRESMKAFEKLKSIHGETSDFTLLAELANLYQVLGDVPKQKKSLAALEAMQAEQAKNPAYWNVMGNLYANLGEVKKAEDAFKKYDEVSKPK